MVTGDASAAINEWTEDELWIARTALYEFAETERDAADDYREQGRHAEADELLRHAEVAETLRQRLDPPDENGSNAPHASASGSDEQ